MQMREMMTSAAVWLAEAMPAVVERSSSDQSIRRALIVKLRSAGWWDPHGCEVMVRDGVVHIAGRGASAQEKIATRAAVASIGGVRGFKDGRSFCVPRGG